MDAAILALKLVPLLFLCTIGPGLIVVRPLRWPPAEKLCGAVAASLVMVYLASFFLFIMDAGLAGYLVTSAIFLCMTALGFPQLKLFLKNHQTRRMLIAFAALLAWDFLHLAMVRSYSGGDWFGDWREHYDRTRYFLHLLPDNFKYLDAYLLPARPPMMNLICAFFCRQVGMRFEAYSLCTLLLNAWAFLPCCLLLRYFRRPGRASTAVLAILFMLNPSIIENVTWTITKAFAAGWVILGLCFYLRAIRSHQTSHLLAAALCLSAGILAHYSALPPAIAVAAHCVWRTARSRRPIAPMLIAACSAMALSATWWTWSIFRFGARTTFFSNSTATGAANKTLAGNVQKVAYNLLTSLVPHPLHGLGRNWIQPLDNLGNVRDYFFLMYQTTLPLMIGSAGAIVAVYLLATRLRLSRERGFWVFFVIFTLLAGTAANPERDPFGAAHVTLQPLALMGVTLAAAWLLMLPLWLFRLALLGAAIDYVLGILLQFDRQSHIYPTIVDPHGGLKLATDPTLGWQGFLEYYAKISQGYVFWGDHLSRASAVLETASAILAFIALLWLVQLRAAAQQRLRRHGALSG